MPQGFQVFDASGNVVVDVTTRLTRYIATARIAWNDLSLHSFSSPAFSNGVMFATVVNQNLQQFAAGSTLDFILTAGSLYSRVNITQSGNDITYQQVLLPQSNPAYQTRERNDIIIHFGVY